VVKCKESVEKEFGKRYSKERGASRLALPTAGQFID